MQRKTRVVSPPQPPMTLGRGRSKLNNLIKVSYVDCREVTSLKLLPSM